MKTVKEALRFGREFKKKRPEHVCKINPDEYYNSWVVKCRFNAEEMKFEIDVEMMTSMYVVGSTVNSLCEYRENSLLLALKTLSEHMMLVTKNWQVLY